MPDLQELWKNLSQKIESEPWYVWAGAAGASAVMLFFIWKRHQASGVPGSTTAGVPATDALNGYQIDQIGGIPFGEMPTGYNYQAGPVGNFPGGSFSEVGVNGNNYPIIPFGDTPIFDANGNLIGFQQPPPGTPSSPNPPPPPPPPPPFPPPPPVQHETMKAVQGGAIASVPGGTNVGGKNIGMVPAGASVEVLQGPTAVTIKGVANRYYQILYNGVTGWINAKTVGGQGDGGFHLPVNATRQTVDQWTFSNGMHQDFDSHMAVGE